MCFELEAEARVTIVTVDGGLDAATVLRRAFYNYYCICAVYFIGGAADARANDARQMKCRSGDVNQVVVAAAAGANVIVAGMWL
jgi:7-cyano-7-deazaguanine synthase in queuosine biosynthesis